MADILTRDFPVKAGILIKDFPVTVIPIKDSQVTAILAIVRQVRGAVRSIRAMDVPASVVVPIRDFPVKVVIPATVRPARGVDIRTRDCLDRAVIHRMDCPVAVMQASCRSIGPVIRIIHCPVTAIPIRVFLVKERVPIRGSQAVERVPIRGFPVAENHCFG